MNNVFMPQEYRPRPSGAELDGAHSPQAMEYLNSSLFSNGLSNHFTLCIGPKSDMVIQTIERQLDKVSTIITLYLEEMYQTWSWYCRNGTINFVIKTGFQRCQSIVPKKIYFRSAYSDSNSIHANKLYDFVNLLNIYRGEILCHPIEHQLNNSKMLQAALTIIPASLHSKKVKCPTSYIIKSVKNFNQLNLKNLVVKSLSGMRSDVVDKEIFQQWNQSAVNHLPVLFQEKISGYDVRVHSLNNKFYAKRVYQNKRSRTYRYNITKSLLVDYTLLDDIEKFCTAVLKSESLNLAGIDFKVDDENNYFCFEINPGPGWSAYYKNDGFKKNEFVYDLIEYLSHG